MKIKTANSGSNDTSVGQVAGVSIYQWGIFNCSAEEESENPECLTGAESKVIVTEFLEKTTRIPAVLGKHFGILYVVRGSPLGTLVNIKAKVLHPPIENPTTKEVYEHTESVFPIKLGAHEFYGWQFQYEWELVPGTYTIQIHYGGGRLGEKRFCVYLA